MNIKEYTFLESLGILEESGNEFGFGEYESEIYGHPCEILWVKNAQPAVKRVFREIRKIRSLIGSEITGIQKIIDINSGSDDGLSFIVYEALERSNLGLTRDDFARCVDTLGELKKKNISGFVLREDTITKNSDGEMKLRFIGLFELFQRGVIRLDRDGDYSGSKPKTSDDILNLSRQFADCFDGDSKFILDKCQNKGYKKYCDLQNDLDSLPAIKNPNYENIQITGKPERLGSLDSLANELNKGCYWVIQNELSDKEGEIQIEWSTKTISGEAFVKKTSEKIDGKKYGNLLVPYTNPCPRDFVLTNGKKAKFNFENGNDLPEDEHYLIDLLYDEHEKRNQLAELDKAKENNVSAWALLPKAEKEYIEERAFRKQYTAREVGKNNAQNIIFSLDGDLANWEEIKQKRNDDIDLWVNDTRVGKILDYKADRNRLITKDYKGDLNAIPEQGELVEDVKQLTSQYKKQVEACDKFKKRDIANPELSALIATPKALLPDTHIEINYDAFESINPKLNNDETQRNTVVEAIHKKPIYLIQGPPGTGKTTVIVEIVQQLIRRNKDTKILIVSQSNMAVDNVLERLPKDMLFMRLVSEHAREDIPKDIQEHIFETKLKRWIKETEQNSKGEFGNVRNKVDPLLLHLYTQYERKSLSVPDFQKEYRQSHIRGHAEKLFGSAKSKRDIENIFRKELGEEYIALKKIQDRWLAFVKNATSVRKGQRISQLKNGDKDIPFNIAYAKSMNVFGATCIHIASYKYSEMGFEFDYMIMDEASKATSAEALVPINMAKNIILIGDHKQLPPVVTKEKEIRQKIQDEDEGLDIDKTYGTSLFEELFKHFENDSKKESHTTMLDIQYRMPRQLGHLISKHIYGGRLKNPSPGALAEYDSDKHHNIKLKLKPVDIGEDTPVPNSIIVVSTSNKDSPNDDGNKHRRCNICNIEAIKETLERLQKQYEQKKETPAQIGIIAAYRGQVERLKKEINTKKYEPLAVEVNTVDKFQGAEREIIIYDLVRSSKGSDNIGFLDDYRRINVAFSRAKKLLIVVGDSKFFIERAKSHPKSKIETKDLVIKNIMTQLQEWGCVYDSLNEAIEND